MGFTILKTEEELAKTGFTVIKPEAPEKEGFLTGAKEFVKGIFTEPLATVGGLGTGVVEAIGETGATLTKGLVPKPKPFTGKLAPTPKFQGAADVLDIRGGTFRPAKPAVQRPLTPEAEKVKERAVGVGKFTGKAAAGIGLSTLVPGAGIPALLGKGALANIPFIPQAFEEGGVGGAVKDIALNTAIDVFTLGASKAIPAIKRAIIGASKTKIADDVAEKLAKDAFKKAKQTPKQVKAEVEKGFVGEAGEKVLPTAAPEKGRIEKAFGRISDPDRSILSEPLGPKDTPFTEHAKRAIAAIANPRNPSPLDVASRKATQAVKEMLDLKNKAGQLKGNIVKKNATKPVEVKSIRESFLKDVEEFLGGSFDEKGVFQGGRVPSQNTMITKAMKRINALGDVTTARQADDIKSSLFDIVKSTKSRQVSPNVTQAEAVIKRARANYNKKLGKVLGASYKKHNKRFTELSTEIDNFQRRIGEVVDPETGQTRMAAGFLKSAIKSNEDRGSKAMFALIKKETGIDLVKEASFARIAMEAVDDPRIRSLLEELRIPGRIGAKIGVVGKAAGKVGEQFGIKRQDKIDELIKFFNKQQGRQFKGRSSVFKPKP